MYHVEVKTVKPRSILSLYGREWESPSVEECTFEDSDTAMMFYRDCISDEDGLRVHAYRVRDAGTGSTVASWNTK